MKGSIEAYVRRVRFASGGGDLYVDRLRQLVARVLTLPREVIARVIAVFKDIPVARNQDCVGLPCPEVVDPAKLLLLQPLGHEPGIRVDVNSLVTVRSGGELVRGVGGHHKDLSGMAVQFLGSDGEGC